MFQEYTSSRFSIPMTKEQAEYTIQELEVYDKTNDPDNNPAFGLDFDETIYEDENLYFLFDENCPSEDFDKFIQQIIKKFNLQPVGYSWGSFSPYISSGGACFITDKEIKYFTTTNWLQEQFGQLSQENKDE